MTPPRLPDAPPAADRPQRLLSLDALRGFDMFWIVGGRELVGAWAAASGWPLLLRFREQLEHVPWHGFSLWDLVFPLFLFVAGAALPFSVGRRLEEGTPRARLVLRCMRRAAALVLLGVLYNDRLQFDLASLRIASVLGRIGLAWLLAALVVLHCRPRAQALWALALLLASWAALAWVPVPGGTAGDLTPGHTLADWLDRQLLPGRLYHGDRDPEGLLGILPASVNALLGALAGEALRRPTRRPGRRNLALAGVAVAALLMATAWERLLPFNKNLWTSSFVLWTSAWSLLLLAAFHQVLDVWRWRRWARPFVVVGANAILIYLLNRFVPFEDLGAWLLSWSPDGARLAGLLGVGLLLRWGLLEVLYRRRIFLRL